MAELKYVVRIGGSVLQIGEPTDVARIARGRVSYPR